MKYIKTIECCFGIGNPKTIMVKRSDFEAIKSKLETMKKEKHWETVWEAIKSDLETKKKENQNTKGQ